MLVSDVGSVTSGAWSGSSLVDAAAASAGLAVRGFLVGVATGEVSS